MGREEGPGVDIENKIRGDFFAGRRRRARSGQAMVELCVAMVAILALTAGMVQLSILARAHMRSMMISRQEAGSFAMAEQYLMPMEARYILGWSVGDDGRAYTRDDVPVSSTNWVSGGSGIIEAGGIESSALSSLIGDNQVSTLAESAREIGDFHLVRGHDMSLLPTIPIARRLFYASDRVSVEGQTFLVWTKGIY